MATSAALSSVRHAASSASTAAFGSGKRRSAPAVRTARALAGAEVRATQPDSARSAADPIASGAPRTCHRGVVIASPPAPEAAAESTPAEAPRASVAGLARAPATTAHAAKRVASAPFVTVPLAVRSPAAPAFRRPAAIRGAVVVRGLVDRGRRGRMVGRGARLVVRPCGAALVVGTRRRVVRAVLARFGVVRAVGPRLRVVPGVYVRLRLVGRRFVVCSRLAVLVV